MKEIKTITTKILSCKEMLVRIILSILLLSAFFVGANFVQIDNEVEAATLTGSLGTNLTYSYDTGTATLKVTNSSSSTQRIDKSKWQTMQNAIKSYYPEHVIFSGNIALPTDSFRLFSTLSYSGVTNSNWHTIKDIDFGPGISTSGVTNMSEMFGGIYQCTTITYLWKFDLSSCTNTSNMFWLCNALKYIDVASWDVSRVTNMNGMFDECETITYLDLSNWNTSNVTDMRCMFGGDLKLKCILFGPNFTTRNVNDLSSMFYNCSELKVLDLRSFTIKSGAEVYTMFKGTNLSYLDLSTLDFSVATKPASSEKVFLNAYVATLRMPINVCGNMGDLSSSNDHFIVAWDSTNDTWYRSSTTASKAVVKPPANKTVTSAKNKISITYKYEFMISKTLWNNITGSSTKSEYVDGTKCGSNTDYKPYITGLRTNVEPSAFSGQTLYDTNTKLSYQTFVYYVQYWNTARSVYPYFGVGNTVSYNIIYAAVDFPLSKSTPKTDSDYEFTGTPAYHPLVRVFPARKKTKIAHYDLSLVSASGTTSFTYNGSAQYFNPTINIGYGATENIDNSFVTLTYYNSSGTVINKSNSINAGTYKCRIANNSSKIAYNFINYKDITYTINPKSIASGYTASLGSTSYTYNGSAQKPSASISGLTLNTDYTVSYPSDCTSVGTKTVTFTGKGNYTGTLTKTYTINAASISGKSITLNPASCTYNGSAQKPTVTVSGLSSNDFNVAYSNNTNAGTATVTVTGKGNYTGTLTKNFTIAQKSIASGYTASLTASSYTYTGSDQCPTATVNGLTLNTDYTVSYPSDKKNVGTKTITFTGKGNYTGSFTTTYQINARAVTDASYTGSTILEYSKSDKKTEVTNGIKLTYNGMTLASGTDYTITFPSDMTSVGDKTITITGKGNYGSSFTKVVSIKKRSIITDYMTISPTSFIYDGTDHKPTLTVYDTQKKQDLVLNKDYENIEYLDNVNVGTGTVRVTGIDLYDGIASKTFTIEPYDIGNADITLTTDKEYEYLKPVPISDDFVIKDTRETIKEQVLSNDGFDFVFKDVDHVGTGSLTITPKASNINYTGSKTIDVVILGIPMTDSRISVKIPNDMEREWEDMAPVIRPLIEVKFNDLVLVDGTDYLVEFKSDMKSGGTKEVELTGLVGFRNSRTDTFTIKDDNPSLLKITPQSGVFRPGDEIEFDFEFSENVFGGPNFVDLTLRPNVGQIEIGSNIMKLRYVTGSTINHNLKMKYTVKEGDEILKGLNAYSSGWSQSDNIKDVSGKNLVPDTLNLMVKNDNFKIITDFATISLIKKGISSDNKNDTVAALSDRDRMSFLLDGEQGLKDRLIIEDEDPKEVQKLMLIDYLSWYFEEVEVEGTTQDEMKADIIKSLKDGIELYDVEKILSSEKSKFDQAQANGKAYTDTKKIYDLVHPLNDEQKTLMKTEFDNLLIYSYVQVESSSVNDDAKSADVKKQQSRDFIEDKVIFDKILKSSEKLSDDEKKYITDKYIEEGDDTVKERVLQRILLYLSDEKIKGGSQNENKEIILRDIYNGIWVDEVEEALKAEIEKEKPNYNWVKLLEMLEVLPLDIQYKTNKELRTFIQDGYLNWRLDEIIKGNLDDPRVPKDPQDPTKPSNPDSPKPADPKNIDPKEKKEAIIKALDDDGIIKRLLELSNLTDDEKKTVLDYIMILDSDVTDEDKEKKNENREKFLEYLADTAMGFDSIQDALQVLSKAIDDFYIIIDARLKIEEYLDIMKNDPDANYWDDILRLLDNLTDKQKQYLPEKFVEEIKKQYEEYLKQIDTKITKSGDSSGSDINIYDVISNLDPEPGDKPNIIINILNDIKNLNELRKLLTSDDVQTKLDDSNKTKQDERVIAGFEFKVVDQKDPKKVIPLKSGAKVEVIFKLPELFAGKTVSFYTIADDGTVKKEIVTMSSAVDGMCKASVLTDKYGKFVVTHNNVETIIRIKSNNGGATGTVTKSSKKSTDYICIPQSPNTVTSVKVYTYDMQTGEYKEDTKLADTLHYPTHQIYEADEVPKGSIIEIQFMTQSSGRKRVKELPSSRRFESYMKGKEVNMFKPNDGLTRAETAVLVSRIISDDKESYEAQGKKWAKKGIENVIAKEIMSTDSKGDFRENDVITRGEFAKVIYKIVEDELDPTVTKKFLDTEGKYYEEYANALLSNGLINGFSDGEFKGDLQITRSEACVMINAATGRSDIADELIVDKQNKDFLEFIDVEDFRWFYKDVMLASNSFEIPNKYYVPEK